MKKISNLCLIMNSLNIEIIRRVTAKIEHFSNVEILKHPHTSILPLNAKQSSFASVFIRPFDRPEVLVTQCVVLVDKIVGQGMALGDSLEKAYCFAIIDAVIAGNHYLAGEIGRILQQQKVFLAEKRHPRPEFQITEDTASIYYRQEMGCLL